MKFLLSILLVGAAAAAPALFYPARSCEAAFRATRVNLDLRGSTLRHCLDLLAERTGVPIERACSCGLLQQELDRPGFTLVLRDVSADGALRLAIFRFSHCGPGWTYLPDRVELRCGRE